MRLDCRHYLGSAELVDQGRGCVATIPERSEKLIHSVCMVAFALLHFTISFMSQKFIRDLPYLEIIVFTILVVFCGEICDSQRDLSRVGRMNNPHALRTVRIVLGKSGGPDGSRRLIEISTTR